MIVETIIKDKWLKPYFLWYLKCMLKMPHVASFLELNTPEGKLLSRHLVSDYNRSYKLLVEKLKSLNLSTDQVEQVIVYVCRHYLDTMPTECIIEGSPELLMFSEVDLN